jgi:nitrite reductase/ring-hydroxylating ferredoxin subunit
MNLLKRISQKVILVLIILSGVFLTSCNKDEGDVIPDVYVDFTLDLLDPEFAGLSVIDASDTVDASTNNWGNRAAGFDNNGIIIYRGPEEFYAYDRTCPYDYAVNGLSIKVVIDFAIAVCPECGTTYSLSTFGVPSSGVGNYSLKNYKTSFDGNRYVRVWN